MKIIFNQASKDYTVPKLADVVKKVDIALPLPQVVNESIRISNSPDCDAYSMAECLAKDPILAAKILQTANSSFFGFLSKAKDIENAVVRLGMNKVRNLVLSLSISKLFKDNEECDGYSRVNVWQHSVAVGMLSELITKYSSKKEIRQASGEALLAGLVHDIGMILADQCIHKKFREVPPLAFSLKDPIHKVEKSVLSFNHPQLAEAVLKKWRFPKSVIIAVAGHHNKFKDIEDNLTRITALSEMLIIVDHTIGFADLPEIDVETFGKLQQAVGVYGSTMDNIMNAFNQQIDEALQVFAL